MSKKLLLVITSIVIVITTIGQQQPENPGFELWEDVGLDVDEPIDWSSIKTSDDGFLNGFAPYVWDQSTDAHSGTYSVRLYNSSVLGIVAAGTITNGQIHADFNPDNGYAFTNESDSKWHTPLNQKPDSVVIWAKFSPLGGDVAAVKALLHTGFAKIPDPASQNWISLAQIDIPDETTTWTRFSAPFNYFNSTTPEYILFVLSAGGANATEGSQVYFDDIELIYNPVVLDLTVFLQGPYNSGNEMFTYLNPDNIPLNQPYNISPWDYSGTENVASIPNTDVVDWILIEIRDASSASSASSLMTIGRQAGLLLKDGSVVGLDGINKLSFDVYINQNLFVVIWHRNHLGIMSAYALSKTDGIYSYDFSDAVDNIYGGASGNVQLEFFGTTLWGMAGGDGDANGVIETNDKVNFWSILTGKNGYLSADYNMDGQTNNPDKNEIWLDNNLTKESQVPE
ncbi:MAG: PCMD domain-containing protein [Bacteroidales bacterium]|nr:PCMD domain-containing protein [Bacteroidales bacterium]